MAVLAPEAPPAIELPPIEILPESVRPAAERYAVDPGVARVPLRNGKLGWELAELVTAVDRAGHEWECALATRAVEARAELVDACRHVTALHDELAELEAAERWLTAFPWHSTWETRPACLYVGDQALTVPEVLGAVEDAYAVDDRLARIARRSPPADAPYAAVRRRGRSRGSPAGRALTDAGHALDDVAELMPGGASTSTVSRWLAGSRVYPPGLPGVLEQLVGADAAAGIVALIPGRNGQPRTSYPCDPL